MPDKERTRRGLFGGRAYILPRLWKYLARYKWLLLLAVLLTVFSNLFALVGPLLSGYAIDAIGPGKGAVRFERVFFYAGWMVGFYALSSLLSYILSVLMIRLSQKVVYQMRREVVDKLLSLPVGFFDRTQTGDIVSRISYDIDTVNASLSNDLLQICYQRYHRCRLPAHDAADLAVAGTGVRRDRPALHPVHQVYDRAGTALCSANVPPSWESSTALWRKSSPVTGPSRPTIRRTP